MAAPTPPSKTPDRHYDFRSLNVVFALSSLALLAVTLFMVMGDFGRPWKRYQSEFRDLERAAILKELEAERQSLNQDQIATVNSEIAAERQRLEERRGEIDSLESDIVAFDREIFSSDAAMRATKSVLDAQKYVYDSALQSGEEDSIAEERETVASLTSTWMDERRTVQELETERDAVEGELEEARSALTASEAKLNDLNAALSGLDVRLETVAKDIDYFMLNAPLMDFLQPTLRIEQVVLSGLFHDINFATIDRVDRCQTCHIASGRTGYDGEEWEEPFRSHPRLDLFVNDGSPHPYSQFGCTACHGGLDRATDFARAGHTPVAEEQLHEWTAGLGWERQKFLETPIHALPFAEAGCLSCHADQVWTPESHTADTGRKLILKMGCYGCHKIDVEAFTDLPKVGPDLRKVASKTNSAWATKWIRAPREFRQTTWMPHFFYGENIKGAENEAFQEAEIASIVDLLWESSETVSYNRVRAGNAARGEELFNSIGCTGCHLIDGEGSREDYLDNLERLHGPNLIGVGSKVSAEWLFAWLKDPKQYRPDTPMPNLRLEDQEAEDLTAYLMGQRNPAWEGRAREPASSVARGRLVLEYLQATMTIEQSEARLAEMSDEEQSLFLGRQSVSKYGCFGCHTIAGFEETKPIGVELTEEASKPTHLLDFGHVHEVEHTRNDWIRTKVQRPRIWDQGKELVKNFGELYRMPNFGMSDREADAVTTIVLGFTKESVIEQRKAGNSPLTPTLAAGRKIVSRYNCQGCHLIEGAGRAIRTAMEDDSNLPPNLSAQGARTQADWLFGFLHDPSSVQLRPWLKVRMPTFDFSDEQANGLISYFAALEETVPFASDPGPADPRSLGVGTEIFAMLQCARCHPAGEDALADLGGGTADLAPSLLLGPERLRHDWVASWIKDPQGWVPGTRMPTNFPVLPDGSFSSPLPNVIDTPPFADAKRSMMRHFDSDDELKEFLGDVDRVSEALRDYIWSL